MAAAATAAAPRTGVLGIAGSAAVAATRTGDEGPQGLPLPAAMRGEPRRGEPGVPGGGGVGGAALALLLAAVAVFAPAPTPFLPLPAVDPRAGAVSTGALPLRGGARRRPDGVTAAAVSADEAPAAALVAVAHEALTLSLAFPGLAVEGVVAPAVIPFLVNVCIPLAAPLPVVAVAAAVAAVAATAFLFFFAEAVVFLFAAPPVVVAVTALLLLFLVFFVDAFWGLFFFELLLVVLVVLLASPATAVSLGEGLAGERMLLPTAVAVAARLLPGGVISVATTLTLRPVAEACPFPPTLLLPAGAPTREVGLRGGERLPSGSTTAVVFASREERLPTTTGEEVSAAAGAAAATVFSMGTSGDRDRNGALPDDGVGVGVGAGASRTTQASSVRLLGADVDGACLFGPPLRPRLLLFLLPSS